MDNLITRLNALPNSYYEFVDSIIDYIDENESRVHLLTEYLDNNSFATPSDVLQFITFQPDFFDDGDVHITDTLLVG